MEYLIRFIQIHESFRKPETDALAELAGLEIDWVSYSEDSPFAIIRFPSTTTNPDAAAKSLLHRSILAAGIYELWGTGHDYPSLHADVHHHSQHLWPLYRDSAFRFEVDSFQGSQPLPAHRALIESFSYTAFEGPIRLHNPSLQLRIFEHYDSNNPTPKHLFLGRLVAESARKAINKYTLKKRAYIATTSMDAELSLVTANLSLAAPGKLAYDPFMGTGSFPLACAHFGAAVFGSDLDGRSVRGKPSRNVLRNFEQYGTTANYLGAFVADLTHTPLRRGRLLDAILCDPPYGVREGLKVLGSHKVALQTEVLLADGRPAHLAEAYIPPKKPYSFTRMLGDVLDFGAEMLVEGGRLCMWMPVAGMTAEDEEERGGEEEEYAIPRHPALELKSECTQHFNKWSRRLLTYRRRRDEEVDEGELLAYRAVRLDLQSGNGVGTADDLNHFRRKYFQGFIDPSQPRQHEKLPHNY